jgi:uncharacterized membrane protein
LFPAFNQNIGKNPSAKRSKTMNVYLIIFLRIAHIIAGILWAGAAVFYLFYIKPSVKMIGPAGPQFMQSLVQRRRYPMFMMINSLLTVVAGGVLFWYASGGLNLAWITTGPGLGFTIGSVAALVAFFVGSLGIGPTSGRLGALGQQIAAAGGPPSPDQLSALETLEKRLSQFETLDFVMLVIAMLTMATARYWVF